MVARAGDEPIGAGSVKNGLMPWLCRLAEEGKTLEQVLEQLRQPGVNGGAP